MYKFVYSMLYFYSTTPCILVVSMIFHSEHPYANQLAFHGDEIKRVLESICP